MPSIVPASLAMGRVRPFPWSTLSSMTRAEARLAASFARARDTAWTRGELRAALTAVLRTDVSFALRRVTAMSTLAPLDGASIVLDLGSRRAVIEAERALVVTATARALDRPAPSVIANDGKIAPALSGAFAAVVSAVMRRTTSEPLRVVFAGDTKEARARAELSSDAHAVELTTSIDHDAFALRVLLGPGSLSPLPTTAMTQSDLARLGEVRLAMPVVASAAWSTHAELSSLRVGDAWMPGNLELPGAVVVAAPWCDRGLVGDLGEDGKIVIRGDVEDLSMSDVAVENAGELPVVVRVEIGAVELRAREWATLGKGDVVTLGQRVGAHVVLRVGGTEVARGELVEIEGEIGVRIVSRTES